MSLSLKDWLIVIPARLHSTRLPRKPLALLGGKPMIERVARNLDPLKEQGARVIVATDHPDVCQALETSEVEVRMTDAIHTSGTDRCQEVARQEKRPFVLNVQGDEPFVALEDLRRVMEKVSTSDCDMATLAYWSTDKEDFRDENVVKVVSSVAGRALYFSRSPLPFPRDKADEWKGFWHHLGIYAFSSASLAKFCDLAPSSLEKAESLEQLRALENGMKIGVAVAKNRSLGIDTLEDLNKANLRF